MQGRSRPLNNGIYHHILIDVYLPIMRGMIILCIMALHPHGGWRDLVLLPLLSPGPSL